MFNKIFFVFLCFSQFFKLKNKLFFFYLCRTWSLCYGCFLHGYSNVILVQVSLYTLIMYTMYNVVIWMQSLHVCGGHFCRWFQGFCFAHYYCYRTVTVTFTAALFNRLWWLCARDIHVVYFIEDWHPIH